MAYRPDIDGLRAIAVILVVLFHASPKKYPSGFIGVDIFFVISGYLITSIMLKDLSLNRFTIKEFYIKRVRRIFPSLLIVILSTLSFGLYILREEEIKTLFKHIAAGTFFVSNIVLWGESGYFDLESDYKPLLHLWSLSIEEQFYIFWPLLLSYFFFKKGNLRLVTGLIILLSFVLNIVLAKSYTSSTFYFIHTRTWELLLGAFLAIQESQKTSIHTSHVNSILGFILIILGITQINETTLFPSFAALFPVVGTYLIISAGKDAFLNKWLFSLRPMVWVGLISYPLYLWHWPILSFLRIVESGDPLREHKNIAIALSVILSILTYKLIEKPIRMNAQSKKMKNLVPALVSLTALLGIFSFIQIFGLFSPFKPNTDGLTDSTLFDLPELRNKNCEKHFPSYKAEFCLLSKNQDPSVILIGDSHAHALYDGFKNTLKDESVLMLGENACAPFFDTSSFPERKKDRCINEMNEALKIAMETKSIKKIYLHFRANTYPGHITIPFQKAFDTTVNKLQGTGKEVFYIYQVAEIDFNPKRCANLRKIRFSDKSQDCRISSLIIKEQQSEYRELIKDIKVNKLDPLDIQCDKDWCHAKIDGSVLYRDKNHLSIDGSNYISRKLLPR